MKRSYICVDENPSKKIKHKQISYNPGIREFINDNNLVTLLTFILTYLILINIKVANLVLLLLLLILKMSSLTIQNNTYEICMSNYTEEINKCENTFTQYTFFKTEFSYKTLEIDYGIKQDKKTFYGHANSNWKTNYITGLNGRARAGSIHYQWLPFSVEIQNIIEEYIYLKDNDEIIEFLK